MNKLLWICLVCLNTVLAQPTNQEIYNFEIGDVLQQTYSATSGGYRSYTTDTLVQKQFSSDNDTIFYTFQRCVYIPPFQAGMTGSVTYTTFTQTVTDLLAPAAFSTYSTCMAPRDTTMIDACGNMYYHRYSQLNEDDTCFEKPLWWSELFPGLGGPYYFHSDPSVINDQTHTLELTYYNTSAKGECGTFRTVDLALSELSGFNILISPIPVRNILSVSGIPDPTTIKCIIRSVEGAEVMTTVGNVESINVSNLSPGTYFLQITGVDKVVVRRFEKL